MQNNTYELSWQNIENGVRDITNAIIALDDKPDVILSTEEDVIVASMVHNRLLHKPPLCIVQLNRDINDIYVDCIPKIYRPIRSGEYDQGKLPSIVIISTLIDDSKNVNSLVEYYKKLKHNVKTMCIYSRIDITTPADYHSMYLLASVRCDFPWSRL